MHPVAVTKCFRVTIDLLDFSFKLLKNIVCFIITQNTNISIIPSRLSEEIQPVIIWEARTGVKKRMFSVQGGGSWPIFKWSYDDKYFAR